MEEELNAITEEIIGASIAVHRALGPGLLESAYEACQVYEPAERGLAVGRQKALPVTCRGLSVDFVYRIDLLVERLNPLHDARLPYLFEVARLPCVFAGRLR